METDVLSLLHKQMDEEKLSVAEALVKGRAVDFADYRRMCGVIRGLEQAQELLEDMQERLRKQEE